MQTFGVGLTMKLQNKQTNKSRGLLRLQGRSSTSSFWCLKLGAPVSINHCGPDHALWSSCLSRGWGRGRHWCCTTWNTSENRTQDPQGDLLSSAHNQPSFHPGPLFHFHDENFHVLSGTWMISPPVFSGNFHGSTVPFSLNLQHPCTFPAPSRSADEHILVHFGCRNKFP